MKLNVYKYLCQFVQGRRPDYIGSYVCGYLIIWVAVYEWRWYYVRTFIWMYMPLRVRIFATEFATVRIRLHWYTWQLTFSHVTCLRNFTCNCVHGLCIGVRRLVIMSVGVSLRDIRYMHTYEFMGCLLSKCGYLSTYFCARVCLWLGSPVCL